MSKAWLHARGVHRGFVSAHRELTVLDGIDLEVGTGELVAITGESGSGKSTLLNLLGSLDRPDRGSILWGEHDLSAMSDGELSRLRNQEIGFVFQAHHLLPDFTALENVQLPAQAGGQNASKSRQRATELLARVGLSERLDHRPGEMSGGEQQRVAVARALMNRPRMLLADEPGGNLDRARADHLHDLLVEFVRDEGLGMVVVTHDSSLAKRAHRWLHLAEGQLRLKTPAEEEGLS